MQPLRLLPPTCDEVLHFRCEDEWRPVSAVSIKRFLLIHTDAFDLAFSLVCLYIGLPFIVTKLLSIAHNLAKVDVEHVSAGF